MRASRACAAPLVALLAAGLLAVVAAPAGAVVGSTPDGAVETNGQVNAVAASGERAFLGGTFTRAGVPTGPGADLAQSDGTRNPAFARPNDTVNAAVSDGAGGWFIGGNFTRVGTLARNHLAHLLADGSVDPAFDPNLDDAVLALVRSGSVLYAGGSFTVVNGASVAAGGTARNRLAAFDTTTGTVSAAFNPNVGDVVFALALSGATLYAGGLFTTVNGGTTRNRVAAFNATTGTATSFNPNVGAAVSALAVDGGSLYVGGSFTTVNGGLARNRLAAFDTTTATATSFNPNVSTTGSSVSALVVSSGVVYAGGTFTRVNGTALLRQRLAAFDATTGIATSFDPDISTTESGVSSLALVGGTLFAGGTFSDVAANSAVRHRLAAFSTSAGSCADNGPGNPPSSPCVVGGFDPNLDGDVNALAAGGSRIYAGGAFTFANADTIRNNLAAMLPDGTLDASFAPTANGTVRSLAVSGSTLYVGGGFTNILALDTTTGVPRAGFTASVTFSVDALAISGGKVYAGGSFTSPRNRLAAFDAATGTLDASFLPNVNGPVSALAIAGGKVYAGGSFTVVNGTSVAGGGTARNRLAAFDPVTGLVDAAFSPNANAAVLALAASGARLFAGGDFTTLNGSTARNRLAALDPATGAVDPAFDASLNSEEVSALALAGTTLYIGGTAAFSGTAQYDGLVAVDATGTGAAIAGFNPDVDKPSFNGGQVFALAASAAHLWAGGTFTSVASRPDLRFARFSEPPAPAAPPAAVSGAASSITTSAASLAGTVDPNGLATAYVFEYGPTLTFGSITTPRSAGSGADPVAVAGSLAGLAAHTTYYYRLVATNSLGTSFGVVSSFTTDGTPVAPVVTTLPVTSPGATTATLAGVVNPNGSQTAYTFEYGTTTSFGAITPVVALDSAIAGEPVSATLTGLAPGTTYLYRVVATNATGTSAGVVRSFTTTPGAS